MEPLNFFGILLESFTIIFSCKKLFTQITIATISPLSLLSLCHGQISELLFSNILHNEASFWLFNIVYVVSLVSLYIVSSSIVIHAVSCVYTMKEVCFSEAMGVVSRVWKRGFVTFGWGMMLIVGYDVAALLLSRVCMTGPAFGLYVLGFVYVSIVWHLAGVVCVLEEDWGVEALIKGVVLVKGKMVISGAVFMLLNLWFVWVQVLVERFVVDGDGMVIWGRVGGGIVCFVVLCGLTLLGLVAQTIVYFVCKGEEMVHELHLEYHEHHVWIGDYNP